MATRIEAPPRTPAPVAAAARVVAEARSAWRRATWARAAVVACTMALGLAAALVLLDRLAPLPPAVRPMLRLLPILAALGPLVRALLRTLPGPDDRRLALLVEERFPELDGTLTTALEPITPGPVGSAFVARAEARLARIDARAVAPHRLGGPAAALGVAGLCLLFLVATAEDGAAGLWRRWAGAEIGTPSAATAPSPTMIEPGAPVRDAGFGELRFTIRPPAYTGRPPHGWNGRSALAALPGSVIQVEGRTPAGATVVAHVIGTGKPRITTGRGDGWRVEWTVAEGDRGLALEAHADGDVVAQRVVPLAAIRDAAPGVELHEPAEDLVVATARGEITIRATARDDYGVDRFHLTWIRSRGSGESFSFDEGTWAWDRVRREGGAVHGEFTLDLAAAGLEPGDVLHLRAVARDQNTVTGPGEGVSRTRVIRIARPDEMDQATTLVGFPIEAEQAPILSQRMIVLMTERLVRDAPGLGRDSILARATEIAYEQGRLRSRVGDQIFTRATGAMQTPDEGISFEETNVEESHGHAHRHDADPILDVNRPLLQAYNAMWAAEGALLIGEPDSALPHQHRALEILQELRQAERVFLRGRQRVMPIDVAGARGTGKIDDAAPAPRSAGTDASTPAASLAELETMMATLPILEPREAGLALAGLAARVLADPALDPTAATHLSAAAEAAATGDRDRAMALVGRARTSLTPDALRGTEPPIATPHGPRSARYFEHLAATSGDTDRATTRQAPVATTPFVFATARYESGDWDSAPLVPTNLIHSLAQYTEIEVAPEGTIVDLASDEIFRYPFLSLTGHLPVRFNERETRNLEAYVDRGGFIFIDDHNHDVDGAFHKTVIAELARIFGPDALRELPNDHEIYRAFFTFDDGPPTTSHELNGWGDGLVHEHLYAIERNGRIGVLYSNKDYSSEWNYHAVNKRFLGLDNTRFGVNVLVYALTR